MNFHRNQAEVHAARNTKFWLLMLIRLKTLGLSSKLIEFDNIRYILLVYHKNKYLLLKIRNILSNKHVNLVRNSLIKQNNSVFS